METKEVLTEIGVFIVKKPKAGARNSALVKAETENGGIKQSIFFMDLLPKCIERRPPDCDQTVAIEHILNSLEIEDYDKLVEALESFCRPGKDESEKKKPVSKDSSKKEECQKKEENGSG